MNAHFYTFAAWLLTLAAIATVLTDTFAGLALIVIVLLLLIVRPATNGRLQ